MAGGFPLGLDICNAQDIGSVTANTTGTVVTSSSSINTKGSWTQLVASTTYDCCWVLINVDNSSASNRKQLLDIGVGGAGSEQVLISNIFLDGAIGFSKNISIPLQIPSGTRISARTQSATAGSQTSSISLTLFDGAFTHIEGIAGADSLTAVTSTSNGFNVTPSASANTKGAYVVAIASTARDYNGLFVSLSAGTVSVTYMYDIAIGASGSETIIIPNILIGDASSIAGCSHGFYIPILIPSGTKISVRSQSSGAASALQILEMLGLYQ